MRSNPQAFKRKLWFDPSTETVTLLPIAILLSLYATRMFGLFVVLPVLALGTENYPGFSPVLLGLAIGIYGLTQALLQVPFGQISDRFGRFPVVFTGLLVFALGSLVCAMADSMWMLVLGRALQGAGAVGAALLAWVIDLTGEARRARVMAVIGISIGLTFLASLALGPFLMAWQGLSGLFLLTAGLAVLGALLSLLLPRPTPKKALSHVFSLQRAVTVSRGEGMPAVLVGVGALHALLMMVFLAVPDVLLESGIEGASQSTFYLYGMLAGAVPAFVMVGMVEKRHRLVRGQALGVAAMAVGLSLFFQNTFLLVACALFFFGFSLLEATLPSLLAKIAPLEARGSATGVYASSQFFGAFLGGALGGPLYAALGTGGLFMAATVVCCFWAFLRYRAPEPPRTRNRLLPVVWANRSPHEIEAALVQVPGVLEVAVSPQEAAAYLKVSKDGLDEALLANVLSPQPA